MDFEKSGLLSTYKNQTLNLILRNVIPIVRVEIMYVEGSQ